MSDYGPSLATAYIQLIPTTDGAHKTITKEFVPQAEKAGDEAGQKAGNKFSGGFKKGVAALLGAQLVTKAIGGVVDFAKESLESLGRIEVLNTQTETVIQSTGAAAKVTAQHVQDLTGNLEMMTATEAESIQEGANMLLTFKNIQNEGGKTGGIFDQTVVAATDMARAMGTDVTSASMMLGKALNDPAAGLSKLSRAGVTFTAEQEAQIKAMQDAGDMAGAQAVMLAELNAQFGGSGAAYASTYQGQMELLGHSLGSLGESIMSSLMPALQWLAANGVKAFNWLAKNQGVLTFVAGFIGATLVAAFTAWTVSIWASTSALLANPITWIVLAIVALIAGLVLLIANWDTVAVWLQNVWNATVQGVVSGFNWIWQQALTIFNAVAAFFTNLWNTISTGAKNIWNSIAVFFTNLWNGITGKILSVWSSVIQWLRNLWSGFVSGLAGIWGSVTGFFSNLWNGVVNTVKSIWNSMLSWFSQLPGKLVGFFKGIGDGISAPFRAAFNGVARIWNNSVGKLSWTIPDWVPLVGGSTLSVPKIPMLAEGGTITSPGTVLVGELGPELLHLPRGASVVPLDRAGDTGGARATITAPITVNTVNERAAAILVSRMIEGLA